VERLEQGIMPIYEPGLETIVRSCVEAGRLAFTTQAAQAVAHGRLLFIAVGTPADEDGSADLQHVLAVARTIASHLEDYRLVVTKSTVPVGTADRVRETLQQQLAARDAAVD